MTRPAVLLLLVMLVGLQAGVRLAPVDPARWHADLGPQALALADVPPDRVQVMPNAALLRLTGTQAVLLATLADLDAVALATPRTRRIAGSVEAGWITWETRSLVWGFPDYTTARILDGVGLVLYARARFGRGDWGVNAARLRDWLARL